MSLRILSTATLLTAALSTASIAGAKPLEDDKPVLSGPTVTDAPQDEDPFTTSKRGGDRQEKMRERMLKRFDADGNGVLDAGEKAAAREAFEQHKGERGRHRHAAQARHRKALLEKFDANGDGKLDKDERAAAREARHAMILERFDANGDGKLDDDEKAAAREARRRHRAELREKRRGEKPEPELQPMPAPSKSDV